MNHKFLTIAMAFAAVAAASCNKDNQPAGPETISGDFSVKATIADASWAENASLALYHSAGDALVSDGEFKLSGDVFKGSLAEAVEDGKEYEWIAVSPYATGAELSAYPVELDGTAAPLLGKVKAAASKTAAPEISMTSLAAYAKINVKNSTTAAIEVSSASITAPESEKIAGKFTADLTAAAPVLKAAEASNVAAYTGKLEVKAGETAEIVFAVAPVTFAAGTELTVKVGENEHKVALEGETVLAAGKVTELAAVEEKPVEVYLCGDAFVCGWDFSDECKLTPSESNPKVLSWTGDVAGNKQFFASFVKSWEGTFITPEITGQENEDAYYIVKTEMEGNLVFDRTAETKKHWKFEVGGNYTFTVNLETNTFSMKMNSCAAYEAIPAPSKASLRGEASGSWDEHEGYIMTQSSTDANEFTWEGNLVTGKGGDGKLFALCVVCTGSDGDHWCQTFGEVGQAFVPETGSLSGYLYSKTGGDVFRIQKDGTYSIVFNAATRQISITAK